MIVYEKNGILRFNNIKCNEEKLKDIKGVSILSSKEPNCRFFKLSNQVKFDTTCYTFQVMFDAAQRYFTDHVEMRVLSKEFGNMPKYPMGGYNFKEKMAYISKYDRQNKDNITISAYELLYPSVTHFFAVNMNAHKKDYTKEEAVYLNRLVGEDKDIFQIFSIIRENDEEIARQILYKKYPEFAIFYYEIFPYLILENYDSYSIQDLKDLKERTEQLRLNTKYIDEILSFLSMAEQNSKVLTLLKKDSF